VGRVSILPFKYKSEFGVDAITQCDFGRRKVSLGNGDKTKTPYQCLFDIDKVADTLEDLF